MKTLELLAPARTAQIGIAAIDCGADAVYLAGPAFGARQAAGNEVSDIARLCQYAHRFGARVFVTVNTIVYEEELPRMRSLVQELAAAGADALIVQDPAVAQAAREAGLVIHASTQCAIRTPEKARFTESLGYGRLVLERELSLAQIRAIRDAVEAEIEFFVHGALCVCYSGQCYLSEYLTGRSANRGACAQACRSLYDLLDENGHVLLKNKAVLSLKDYRLLHRLQDLAEAGVLSFKIEGRLKGESYVRNVVRAYSQALDALVEKFPDRYCRASFGSVRGGFAPNLEKSFNRGFTELFLDGQRGPWSSMDAPKSMGEYVGTVAAVGPGSFVLKPAKDGLALANGDGFAFVGKNGQIIGFRADVSDGMTIRCKAVEGLRKGVKLYRNSSAAFEKTVETQTPVREMQVELQVRLSQGQIRVTARREDGVEASTTLPAPPEEARDPERMRETIRTQLGKSSGIYHFSVAGLETEGPVPFMGAAFLNGIRRSLAEELDPLPVQAIPLREGRPDASVTIAEALDYKENIANSVSRAFYTQRGARQLEPAYELTHREGAELMRSKYCVRHELGLCPRQGKGNRPESLHLRNGGRSLRLDFDCAACEMTVSAAGID